MKTKILSVALTVSLAVTSFASLAITANAGGWTMGGTFNLNGVTGQVTATNGMILTGTINYKCWVVIPAGYNVTLRDVTIDGSKWQDNKWAAIHVTNGSNGDSSTITLEGTNTVKGFDPYYPGIYVSEGKTLYIEGSGTLNASSSGFGPGIGSAFDFDNDEPINCGNIVINGGTVNATGGEWAAGIGTATSSECGNITINGGTVTATGGGYGAGIGTGAVSTCGDITINGGTVTATGGDGAVGIGSGVLGTCGDITIEDTVERVTAVKGGSRTYEGLEAVPGCIGASEQADYADWYGYNATVGTITIGGDTNVDTGVSPYIYEPVHTVIKISDLNVSDKITCNVSLTSPNTINGIVLVGVYDSNDSLLEYEIYDAESLINVTMDAAAGEKIKAMWWESIEAINPLVEADEKDLD